MRISDWSSDVCSSDLSAGGCRAPRLRSAWRPDRRGRHEHPVARGPVVCAAAGRVARGAGALCRMLARPLGHRAAADRESVVKGKSVSVRVDVGGRSIIKKKTKDNIVVANYQL